ncbi:MAG: hypothetical protein ABSG46_16585 [Candidatus Binataceae bacterium]
MLTNTGDADAELPQSVELPDSCTIGDGANGYALAAGPSNITLQRQQTGFLRSHRQQVIGWMRCSPTQGEIHVRP